MSELKPKGAKWLLLNLRHEHARHIEAAQTAEKYGHKSGYLAEPWSILARLHRRMAKCLEPAIAEAERVAIPEPGKEPR